MIEFRYKGYIGQLIALEEDGQLHGEVIGLNDVITFASKSPKKLEKEFQKSVDDYLEFCAELGRDPEKTCSGKFQVRIPRELHGRAIIMAKSRKMSLNEFVGRSIAHAVREPDHVEDAELLKSDT